MLRRPCFLMFALLASLSAGCGGPRTGTVSGDVTLDGQPMKKGQITFAPVDGKSTGAMADVADGKFSATVPAGEMKVAIVSDKVVGTRKMYDTPDSPKVDVTVQVVAPRFNTTTTLKTTVKGGSQTEKYDVTSK